MNTYTVTMMDKFKILMLHNIPSVKSAIGVSEIAALDAIKA